MEKMFQHHKDISDWGILSRMTIHAFNEDETPIEVLQVCIGELEVTKITLANHYIKNTYPIIRWITAKEYHALKEQEGTVIW